MSQNIKIAQVVCILPPEAGGIGMVAHSYADQLKRRDYDVTVFVPAPRRDVKADKAYKVVTLWPWLRSGLGAVMPQLFWRLWSFDIIHFHYPLFGSAFIIACLKKIRGEKIKLIITYHMDVNLDGWRKAYENIFRKLLLKFILDQADRVIVSSEDYIENSRIQDYYFKNINKFIEVPFGVSRVFQPKEKDEALLAKYQLTKADKVVGFVGGLGNTHYFKGINFLIKAASFLPDQSIKILVIGGGNMQNDYERLAEKLNLADRVRFTGYAEKRLLVEHYNLCDIFVLPSINSSEAFGIVLIEAMACGKPVIASNLKGVRSVVDPGVNGLLVEPKNSRDLADKIKYLFDHPEKMKLFGESGLASVAVKYRWAVITDKLEAIYHKLLKK